MKRTAAFLFLTLAAVGCSSSDDKTGSTSGALQAPMLMHCMPMAGALHLEWMNMQKDCDSVEGERMMHSNPFEPVFAVPGSVDNKMDGTATEDMDYTYRLRCKKGDKYSDYSNQISANPTHGSAGGGG